MKKFLCISLVVILVIALVIALFAVALLAVFKGPELYYRLKYREEKIIGMSSQEVVEKYGKFDRPALLEAPGLWKNCKCGYRIKEAGVGLFGDWDVASEYFMIYFNEEGIAYKCEVEYGEWRG